MPFSFSAMRSTRQLIAVLVIVLYAVLVVLLTAKQPVVAKKEQPPESIRTKAQLIAPIPPTADIYGPAELAWCTTLILPGPELFVTLHGYGFAQYRSGGGSHFAIHRREPAGYRTIFRHATEDGYVIDERPLVCDYSSIGDGSFYRLFYVEDHSTGTDGRHQPHLWILMSDGGIQEIEWVYPHLPVAKNEDASPPDILFRDDDLAFKYGVYRIHDESTHSAGEHVADVVGSYRLVANPPAEPPQKTAPFRLEIQTIRRVTTAKGD